MRITGVQFHKINIPFEAPMLWSGGVNRSWTRIVVRMQTDEGIERLQQLLAQVDVVDDLGGEQVGEVAGVGCPLHHVEDFAGEDGAGFRELAGKFLDVLNK